MLYLQVHVKSLPNKTKEHKMNTEKKALVVCPRRSIGNTLKVF